MSHPPDQADRMTATILLMFIEGMHAWIFHGTAHSITDKLTNFVRDEIDDAVRNARKEYDVTDD